MVIVDSKVAELKMQIAKTANGRKGIDCIIISFHYFYSRQC